MFSPLEQFLVSKLISISVDIFDLSFTNSSLIMLMFSLFGFLFSSFSISRSYLISTNWQLLLELVYEFVYYNLLIENVKKNGNFFFPFLFTIFFFILLSNLVGLVPYSFTVTSHIAVTLALSTTSFVALNILLVKRHGFHAFSFFLPSGAPLILAFLLVPIEIVSYSFRVVSLALRLFANMMSGHCLLKILAGFSWTMFSSGGLLVLFHIIPLIVVFAIIGLEFCIGFLQAYVFTVLLCIYLNDTIMLH